MGTIEEATLSVSPKGLFMEYGLYLTFSARGTNFNQNDSVEVVLDFELPQNAIVTDSWLWIGEDISKAIIMDRWSASSIYEDIVKRRKDPSILTKENETQYSLRIFPMVGNSTRKVKITYLVPVEMGDDKIYASLPVNILKTSSVPVYKFQILMKENLIASTPFISNFPTAVIKNKTDIEYGDYKQVEVPSTLYNSDLKVAYTLNQPSGIFFSKTSNGNEGVYQLAFSPSNFLDEVSGKKIAVLLDYDIANTGLVNTTIINNLKTELLSKLGTKDSFVVMFSNMSIARSSEKWQSASLENINQAFQTLNNNISNYSNLTSLISNGVDFIKKNGNEGIILLVSNSSQYGAYAVANNLINDITNMSAKKISFHIADYQSQNYNYYYINGTNFSGNEYFYQNLAKITGGTYQRVRDGFSQSGVIAAAIKNTNGIFTSFDLHTKLETGFCYSRYNITEDQSVSFNDIIRQTGKFNGTFPFIIEFSGLYNSKPFSKTITIYDQQSINGDSSIHKIWTGQFIKSLEKSNYSNNTVNEIIYNSVKNRVLSTYTAFLCLENKIYYCEDCVDESDYVNVISPAENTFSLKAYPNPFVNELSVEFNCENPDDISEICIFNLNGAEVYKFETSGLSTGTNILKWNGLMHNGMQAQSGVYILKLKSNKEIITLRLIKK
jgi:Ca-activated chloride channel family protein